MHGCDRSVDRSCLSCDLSPSSCILSTLDGLPVKPALAVLVDDELRRDGARRNGRAQQPREVGERVTLVVDRRDP